MTRPSSAECGGVPAVPVVAGGKVWFIGAGPGDPELITVKGRRLIRQADLVLYAGSLVPRALVAEAGCDSAAGTAEIVDSSVLNLQETHALCCDYACNNKMVARVHTGDPALYGAVREQAQLLRRDGIAYAVVPGVSAAFAAAAVAGISFTVPEVTQTVILTRLPGRTPVPERERLCTLAAHGCSLAVYLSAGQVEVLQAELADLPQDTPVICAYRVGWPDEHVLQATIATMAELVRAHDLDRQVVFLVLPGERGSVPATVSRLYAPEFSHACRSGSAGTAGQDVC